MRHLLLILIAAACSKTAAQETPGAGSGSAAAKPTGPAGAAAPAPAPPAAPTADETALRLASTGKKPYDDKQILKTAVVAPWKAGEADGAKFEELIAAVTVYDPRNRKCWAWNKVSYRRSPGGSDVVQHEVSYKDADVAEVGCATVGFTPPAKSRKKSVASSSGGPQCRRGETVCNANCTNLMNDRMNCGACGHECTGDKFACNDGRCW